MTNRYNFPDNFFLLMRFIDSLDRDSTSKHQTNLYPNLELAFPNHETRVIACDNKNIDIRVNIHSLVGALGVLPIYFTEQLQRQVRLNKNIGFDFITIFQQRLLHIHYACWKKAQLTVDYELKSFRYLRLLGHWLGHAKSPIDFVVRQFALFHNANHNCADLQRILVNEFGFMFIVKHFSAHTENIPWNLCSIIARKTSLGRHQALGSTFILGTKIRMDRNFIDIEIIIPTLREYKTLLTEYTFDRVKEVVSYYLGNQFKFRLTPILQKKPALQLSRVALSNSLILGHTFLLIN